MNNITKHSALYEAHAAHHATFTGIADWTVPARYGDPDDEARRVRTGVGIIDRSAMGKFEISGRRLSEWFAQRFAVETPIPPLHARRMAVGGSAHALWCQLREDRAVCITEADVAAAALAPATGEQVHLTDITSTCTLLQIAGPQTISLLRKFTSLDVRPSRFPDRSCAQTSVAKVRGLIVREDIGALPAFWLMFTRDYAEFVWESLTHAGATPFGQEAHEKIRGTFIPQSKI